MAQLAISISYHYEIIKQKFSNACNSPMLFKKGIIISCRGGNIKKTQLQLDLIQFIPSHKIVQQLARITIDGIIWCFSILLLAIVHSKHDDVITINIFQNHVKVQVNYVALYHGSAMIVVENVLPYLLQLLLVGGSVSDNKSLMFEQNYEL